MKIAVAYNAGQVYGHFGEAKQFEIYTIEGANIVKRELNGTNGKSHIELVGLLVDWNINVLLVGGIGSHAINILNSKNIQVFPGVKGDSEAAVIAYLNGELSFNPNAVHQCSHSH